MMMMMMMMISDDCIMSKNVEHNFEAVRDA